ncbi:hypothetical protein GOBAR_AA23405 [Gossypium barbadense]|uniref:Uncharacterized protein n=1 Tax=Gossypium barbadense TaxID=3634 RepID=A0A2P5X1R0_GOSBA|nr:hypothetical protein GOBAR_AA23405 [Gossypium barbadense]
MLLGATTHRAKRLSVEEGPSYRAQKQLKLNHLRSPDIKRATRQGLRFPWARPRDLPVKSSSCDIAPAHSEPFEAQSGGQQFTAVTLLHGPGIQLRARPHSLYQRNSQSTRLHRSPPTAVNGLVLLRSTFPPAPDQVGSRLLSKGHVLSRPLMNARLQQGIRPNTSFPLTHFNLLEGHAIYARTLNNGFAQLILWKLE